jgi:hypothetical protein
MSSQTETVKRFSGEVRSDWPPASSPVLKEIQLSRVGTLLRFPPLNKIRTTLRKNDPRISRIVIKLLFAEVRRFVIVFSPRCVEYSSLKC